MSSTFTWRGKSPADLTREELIEALNSVADGEHRMREAWTNGRIKDLEKEIQLKDLFIEKLIRAGR